MAVENSSYFGTFLRTWRKRRGLYKKEAANTLRVPLRTYEDWEWAKRLPNEIVRTEIARRVKESDNEHTNRKTRNYNRP